MIKKLNRKMIILSIFLLICCVSFSAMSGAKYLSLLITALEDLAADGRKVAVAVAVFVLMIVAAKALFGTDVTQFMNMLYNNTFIIAILTVVTTLLVAVGGATIDENILKAIEKNPTSVEKNLEVYYESE